MGLEILKFELNFLGNVEWKLFSSFIIYSQQCFFLFFLNFEFFELISIIINNKYFFFLIFIIVLCFAAFGALLLNTRVSFIERHRMFLLSFLFIFFYWRLICFQSNSYCICLFFFSLFFCLSFDCECVN